MKVRCVVHDSLNVFAAERWPDQLPKVPRVGDLVRSAHAWPNGFRLELVVAKVRWVSDGDPSAWLPELELSLPANRWGSVSRFYDDYLAAQKSAPDS